MILLETNIMAGFPSPAEGATNHRLSLDDIVIQHPEATFFMKMQGEAMVPFGIFPNDILVVDRALTPRAGSMVVVFLAGEWLVRRLARSAQGWYLESAEGLLVLDQSLETMVWGVVSSTVHKL